MKRLLIAAGLAALLAGCGGEVQLTQEQAALANEVRNAPPRSVLVRQGGSLGSHFFIVCGSQNGRIETAAVGMNSHSCNSVAADHNTNDAEHLVYYSRVVRVVKPTDPEYDGLIERLVMDFVGVNRPQQ